VTDLSPDEYTKGIQSGRRLDMLILAVLLFAGEWIETTQEDFADGLYEYNLYASHREDGAVEFAGRFDLNNDDSS
jgi:hypothetical protein